MTEYYWERYTFNNGDNSWEYDIDSGTPHCDLENCEDSVMRDIKYEIGINFELNRNGNVIKVYSNVEKKSFRYIIKQKGEVK